MSHRQKCLPHQIWKLNEWENYSFIGYLFYICFDELDSTQFLSRFYQNSEMCQFDIVHITMGKLIYFTSHVCMEIYFFFNDVHVNFMDIFIMKCMIYISVDLLLLLLLGNKVFEPNFAGVGWCYSITVETPTRMAPIDDAKTTRTTAKQAVTVWSRGGGWHLSCCKWVEFGAAWGWCQNSLWRLCHSLQELHVISSCPGCNISSKCINSIRVWYLSSKKIFPIFLASARTGQSSKLFGKS